MHSISGQGSRKGSSAKRQCRADSLTGSRLDQTCHLQVQTPQSNPFDHLLLVAANNPPRMSADSFKFGFHWLTGILKCFSNSHDFELDSSSDKSVRVQGWQMCISVDSHGRRSIRIVRPLFNVELQTNYMINNSLKKCYLLLPDAHRCRWTKNLRHSMANEVYSRVI